MTIEVVASYVAHNSITPDDMPAFIATTHAAIKLLDQPPEEPAAAADPALEFVPAATVRKSLASREYILSPIDGKPYKTLKRHLSGHGLTPAQYRERYGLKADYPTVAPAYSDHRREVAKTLGLGRKVGARAVERVAAPAEEVAASVVAPAAAKRGRKPAAPNAVASSAVPVKAKAAKTAGPKASARKAIATKAETIEPTPEGAAPKARAAEPAPARSPPPEQTPAKLARATKKAPPESAAPADAEPTAS